MDVRLVVSEGKAKGREIPLPGTMFLIGRGAKCHLRPHCRLVSKLHCAIASWAGKVAVRDLNSANGTYVNDKPVRGEVRVFDGDVLQVGSLAFTFRVNDSSESVPVPVVRESDVGWLMESPEDSSLLSPDQTQHGNIPMALFPETFGDGSSSRRAGAEAGPDRRAKAPLSAGQYLRDYFRQRKAGRIAESRGKRDKPE